jgi:hypothetical protein
MWRHLVPHGDDAFGRRLPTFRGIWYKSLAMLRDTVQARATQMRSHRCASLFYAQVALFVLLPFLQGSEGGRIGINLFNLVIMITAVTAMGRSRLAMATALLLALPAFALAAAGIVSGEILYLVVSWGFSAGVYVLALISLMQYIFSVEEMTTDKLYGAASAYLLLGVLWAYMYALLERVYPGSFAIAGAPAREANIGDLIYFSFTTLTTTGFGDIVPVLRHAQMLTILEQVTGVLFVAILIARLTGIYQSRRDR